MKKIIIAGMKLKKKRKIIYKNTNEQQSLFGKVIEAFEKKIGKKPQDWLLN